jgi:hypothetical protein
MIKLYELRGGDWVLLGNTERVRDDMNPAYETKIVVDFNFEE